MRVIQVGLGPIGLGITEFLAKRQQIDIVGAVDVNPSIQAKDLGELAGIGKLGVSVTDDVTALNQQVNADIAVVTTSSSVQQIWPLLRDIISAGLPVVTTCEELSYPWHQHQVIATQIDALAKHHQVAVLATGVNPGFLMDYLPVVTTAISEQVNHILIQRIQDATQRRVPFQKKIGAGLTVEAFQQKVQDGSLRHVGLKESVHFISAHLQLGINRVTESLEPVIAQQDESHDAATIKQGDCLGVLQVAKGFVDEKEVVQLVFKASLFEKNSVDEIIIQGEPDLHLKFQQGVNGDSATKAITVNAIPTVISATPGLHTMADIKPVKCFT